MSSTFHIIVLLGAIALVCPGLARPQAVMPGPEEDIARLRGQVQKGDADAIVKAGDTYNPVFIGDLRALQKSLKKKESDIPWLIRISLAKLGDEDALQETYCRVQSRYPLIKQHAVESDLTKIGGWFSIWVLQRQFEEDDRWRKAPRKYWKSVAPDVILVQPSNLALMILPELVKDPPLPSPSPVVAQMSPQQTHIATWKTWIEANSATLKSLKPEGQDVNTSPTACAPYHTKEKDWLAAITH
jgi:hypothetical protein